MATTYQQMLLSLTYNPGFFNGGASDSHVFLNKFESLVDGLVSGAKTGSIQVQQINDNATTASGTFTVSSGAAGDTAVINGTTLTCVDHRETDNVAFVADVSGSLNSTYITFQDQPGTHKYYMWFNINNAGVDPAPAGRTGIQVAGATNVTAANLASAAVTAATAAAPTGMVISAGASGHIIITNNVPGTATAAANGTASPGFTISRTITGSAVTTAQYQVYSTDTLTAASLAGAVGLNTSISPYVTATSATTVVTVTATAPGLLGNAVTTAATGNVTAGAARLTGGANDTTTASTYTYHYGF